MMILLLASAAAAASVPISVVPAQPLLERTLYGQAMNCDFRVANRGSEALELRVVNLAVRDKTGALIAKLELNDNGIAPGIEIVSTRKVAAGGGITLFNPFDTLAAQ